MNLTSLARPFFERRYQQIIQNTQRVEDVQRSVLTRLLRQAPIRPGGGNTTTTSCIPTKILPPPCR